MKFAPAAAVAMGLLLSLPSAAQSKSVETAARGLQKKAMQEDYLATEFDKAADKLNQGIKKCGADKCSATLRAELRRDLGVVLIGGQVNKEQGLIAWMEALRIDPGIQLDPDVKTKDLEQLFDQAKKTASGVATTAPVTAPAKPEAPAAPSGDFVHTPPTEAPVRTPLPIYAEYTGSEKVVRVIAKYKGFGMTEWKNLELRRLDRGWGATAPCTDVQQGEFAYYLQGFDAQNDPVASAGDRNNPFRVPVKTTLSGEAPHLPGQAAPKACAEQGDCPPGLPGCEKGGASLKDEGLDCSEDEECKSGQCRAGKCTAPPAETKAYSRFWLGIAGAFDIAFIPNANGVCKLAPQGNRLASTNGYFCVDSGGGDFPVDATQNEAMRTDTQNSISGGAAPGNVRVLLSFDYAFTANFLLGARIGYVTNTYPGQRGKDQGRTFAPVHLELRATYVFGKDALGSAGLAPIVFVGGGASEFDAGLDVKVRVTGETPEERTVRAWYVGGPGFFTAGVGLRYAIVPRAAISLAAKFQGAFGGAGFLPMLSPELGVQLGF